VSEDSHPAQHNKATVQWIVARPTEVNGICLFRLPTRTVHARKHRAVLLPSLPFLLACIFFYFAFFSLFLSLFCFNFPLYSSISCSCMYFLLLFFFCLFSPVPLYYISFITFFFLPRMFLSSTSSRLSLCPTPSNSSLSSLSTPLTAQSAFCLCLFKVHLFTVLFVYSSIVHCLFVYCSFVYSLFVSSLFVYSLFVRSSFKAALITKLRLAGRPAHGMRQLRSSST